MKKTFFVFLFFLLGEVGLAQDIAANPVRFGVRAGLNYSHMDFSKGYSPTDHPLETSRDPGIVVGFFMAVPLTGNLYVQPEYLYSQMGGKVENSEENFSVNYLSLPVLLRWEVSKSIALLAGPQFELVIDAQRKNQQETFKLTKEMENRHIGIVGEVEIAVLRPLSLSIRYLHGLNNVGLYYNGMMYEFEYELWQLSAAYKF